jgi:TPR repeat protein
MRGKLYAEAIVHYACAVQYGSQACYYQLGVCYLYLDDARAINYLVQAANAGHVEAMYELGECYQYGKLIAASESNAIKYYQLAAAKGHADAKAEANKLNQIKQKRENIARYNKEGDAATAAELYDKAIAAYDKAIAEGDTYAVNAKKKAAQLKVEKQKRDRIAAYNKEGDAAIAAE